MMGRMREGYRQPEERTLADLMVGHRIILRYAVGPDPDPDDPAREVTGPMQARTGAYWLHAVSHQGLEVSRELTGEEAGIFLVPWGGVLVLNGVPRGDLEEEARRKFAIDRQKLLDRLEDPQERDANLGFDARRFLGFNPYDKEVRAALGRLPIEYTYP
jgi:hypothetical protein